MIICPGCLQSVGKDELECPFCGYDLFEESFREEREEETDGFVDEEPTGPEPVEYRWVLVFAVVLVLGALLWGWLSHLARVMLK